MTLFQYWGLALLHWNDLRHWVGIPNYRRTSVSPMFQRGGKVSYSNVAETANPVRMAMKASSYEEPGLTV
jgi:hypothetical protein